MTIPHEYRHASADFDEFLLAMMNATGLATRNQAYTVLEGILLAFRRRLNVSQGLRFANVLPPVLRAIFVKDWDVNQPPVAFGTREDMTREVKALRQDHNFAPDNALSDVAKALRQNMNEVDLDAVLNTLPNGAQEFWKVL